MVIRSRKSKTTQWPRVDMSFHSETSSWIRSNTSMFWLIAASVLAEKQQMPISFFVHPRFLVGFVIFSFICMFCWSLFVILYFLFWSLCCLFFFDIRILISPLVSSNSSLTRLVIVATTNHTLVEHTNYYTTDTVYRPIRLYIYIGMFNFVSYMK